MTYEHIEKELEIQGKTKREMANVLGRTHAVATNIFNGVRPIKIDEVPILAKWLNKSQNFILRGTDGALPEGNLQNPELKAAREQLNSAIEMWTKHKPDSLIHALTVAAYKAIRPSEKDKDLDSESAERMILSSIMGLKKRGEILNDLEIAFEWWLADNNPQLIKNESRAFISEFLQSKGINNVRKLSREEFFKAITGDNINDA